MLRDVIIVAIRFFCVRVSVGNWLWWVAITRTKTLNCALVKATLYPVLSTQAGRLCALEPSFTPFSFHASRFFGSQVAWSHHPARICYSFPKLGVVPVLSVAKGFRLVVSPLTNFVAPDSPLQAPDGVQKSARRLSGRRAVMLGEVLHFWLVAWEAMLPNSESDITRTNITCVM